MARYGLCVMPYVHSYFPQELLIQGENAAIHMASNGACHMKSGISELEALYI